MESNISCTRAAIGFLETLTVLLVAMKISGLISISLFWCLIPILIPALIYAGIYLIALIIALIDDIF